MTSTELIRSLYAYHRWANRRLFDVAAALGDAALARDMGAHWSVPSVKGMFAHLCSADALWLARWRGGSPTRMINGGDFATFAEIRPVWDAVEADQQGYVEALTEADLGRIVSYKTSDGAALSVPLGPSLQHVANHATHHRSEVATMITLISGSPPDTGINTYRTVVLKG
jgi:uncharacterized damage-inducible protein DinB